jgi:hypothetical protein
VCIFEAVLTSMAEPATNKPYFMFTQQHTPDITPMPVMALAV